jgi:serine/threonine-protein kinase
MNHGSSSSDPSLPDPARRSQTGALPEGSLFAGRYRIVRCMAAGAMGSVYEVVHTETERRRALKVMHPHLFQSEEMRERFKREARIAAQVESEYIVDVSDAGVDEATKTPFLVMELLQGEELGDRLARLGALPPAEVVTYLHQVALALDRTHAKMIVHRDLKPENLFLTLREDGSPRVKILDFGVAKVVAEGATGAGATRSLGTPLYMAPEQFRAGVKLLPAADIYALGMMAYTLLVGEPYWAFEARNAGDVIAFAMTVIQGPKESAVARAAARGVMLPAAFDGWFGPVTAVNPGDRFSRATEAVRALGEVLGARASTGAGVAPNLPERGSIQDLSPRQATPAWLSPAPAMTAPLPPGAGDSRPAWMASPPLGAGSGPVAMGSGPLDLGGGTAEMTVPPAGLSNPHGTPGVFERASTSTGAAVGAAPVQRPRSRAPLVAAVVLVSVGVVGVGGWLIAHTSSGVAAAAGADPTSPRLATSEPTGQTERPATAEPAQASPTTAAAAPEVTPAGTPPRPLLTGVLPGKTSVVGVPAAPAGSSAGPKPTAATTTQPKATPTAKPAVTFNRDL